MKKHPALFILLLISISCFSQQHGTIKVSKDAELDSLKATNLLIGTWVDTKDSEHSFTFMNKVYKKRSDNLFYEKGIRKVSGDTGSVVVSRENWHGIFWTSPYPLDSLSKSDTDGTAVILVLVPFMNSTDTKWTRRIILLNDTYLKFQVRDKEATLFKRKD